MDVKEASAMTEASGLVGEQDCVEQGSGTRRRPLQSSSGDAAMRWVDRLREVTVEAPMPSLFVAFLLGVWVARRYESREPAGFMARSHGSSDVGTTAGRGRSLALPFD